MDDVGLGGYLSNFGYGCAVVLFVVVFLLAKYVIRMSTVNSFILAFFVGVGGYLASPYVFFFLFSLLGYSF